MVSGVLGVCVVHVCVLGVCGVCVCVVRVCVCMCVLQVVEGTFKDGKLSGPGRIVSMILDSHTGEAPKQIASQVRDRQ